MKHLKTTLSALFVAGALIQACAGTVDDSKKTAEQNFINSAGGTAGTGGSDSGGTAGTGMMGTSGTAGMGMGGTGAGGATPADIAAGLQIYMTNQCYNCHEMDLSGGGIMGAANITPDPTTGIGSWTVDDIEKLLTEGTKPDGTHVCATMSQYSTFSQQQLLQIAEYVKSVAPVNKKQAACM